MKQSISTVASLITDSSRATMLVYLMDGRVHPASDLALQAKITPQTASFHLQKLLDANILEVEKHGKHRYYKLADNEVAQMIEQFLQISPEPVANSFKAVREKHAIKYARTCYDHLAGFAGVQVTNALLEQDFIKKAELNFVVTDKGKKFFQDFQIDVDQQRQKRRAFARCCLDWSERQHHLAGALGNALLEKFFELNWIERIPETRAIKITPEGTVGLKEKLLINL